MKGFDCTLCLQRWRDLKILQLKEQNYYVIEFTVELFGFTSLIFPYQFKNIHAVDECRGQVRFEGIYVT